jgi:ABC-2 type transport system permease protein
MFALFAFTVRQILGQRKLWLTAVILLFPAAIVVLVRSFGGEPRGGDLWDMYHVLMQFLLIMLLIPLVCLLYGTALVGAEIEQRTLVYLTTRRLHRATVLLVRFAATWVTLSVLFALAILALHVCVTLRAAVGTLPHTQIAWQPWHDLRAYLAVAPAGAAGFLALFTTISLVFRRPLIFSVLYVVVFELVVGNLPLLARRLSIGHLLRQTLVQQNPVLRRLYELPDFIADLVYPPGQTGTSMLLTLVAVLLLVSGLLMTVRELTPARVGRD